MSLSDHAHRDLYRIRGFLHPVDTMLFCALLGGQAEHKIAGSLVEIGVFFGRSLYLLGENAKTTGSKALGIDLFDISGQRTYVDELMTKHGLSDTIILKSMNSADVTAQSIINEVGRARFFHIDGGHEYHHLENDTKLALASIAENGVIVFDDFMNPQYPDLTVAVIDMLRQNKDRLVPLCISKSKLYTVLPQLKKQYSALIKSAELWNNARLEEFLFLGEQTIHVAQPVADRAIYEQFAKRGLGHYGRFFAIPTKQRNARQ